MGRSSASAPESVHTIYIYISYSALQDDGNQDYSHRNPSLPLKKNLMPATIQCKGLGADHVLNYKEVSKEQFSAKVMEFTDNKGVDYLLDPVCA